MTETRTLQIFLSKDSLAHWLLNKVLQQLVAPPASLRKVDRGILSNLVVWNVWNVNFGKIGSVVILRDAQVVHDAGALDKLAGLLQALESDSVLEGEKAMLDDAETTLHAISSASMGRVEPLFGSVELTTVRSDQPFVVGISGVTQDDASRKNSFASGLKCFPERGFAKNLRPKH